MPAAHVRSVGSINSVHLLKLGYCSARPSTFLLCAASGSDLTVEPSPFSVDALSGYFAQRGLASKAKAVALDFLTRLGSEVRLHLRALGAPPFRESRAIVQSTGRALQTEWEPVLVDP